MCYSHAVLNIYKIGPVHSEKELYRKKCQKILFENKNAKIAAKPEKVASVQ